MRNRCESAAADSHTVERDSTVAEGTPPGTRPNGWQVSWLAGPCILPPSRPVADRHQWHQGKRSPLTVAGAAVGWYRRQSARDAYHIPSSLSRLREAIKRRSTTLRPEIVNRTAAICRLLSGPAFAIVAGSRMHYPRCVSQVLDCNRRGLASETGIRCKRAMRALFRDCPRNGKRIEGES